MPKIVGLLIFAIAEYALLSTMHIALRHFIEYGATNNEIAVAIGTIFIAGAMSISIVWYLFG